MYYYISTYFKNTSKWSHFYMANTTDQVHIFQFILPAKLLALNDGLLVSTSRKSEMPRHLPLDAAQQILYVLSLNLSLSALVNKVFG
jgi:hypothetical protein